ncbi:MAG TPA: PDGLE domain-containing protein [Acidimicrobiia bacterium]|nr:PDGLE domain-containing protein [Acidimicrobiia bacterium]
MDKRLWWFLGIGLVVVLVVAGLLSGFAADDPDGLERVAIDEGFDETAEDHALADSPLADYAVEGVEDGRLSTGLAGVIGVAITLVIAGGLFYGIRLYGKPRSAKEDS